MVDQQISIISIHITHEFASQYRHNPWLLYTVLIPTRYFLIRDFILVTIYSSLDWWSCSWSPDLLSSYLFYWFSEWVASAFEWTYTPLNSHSIAACIDAIRKRWRGCSKWEWHQLNSHVPRWLPTYSFTWTHQTNFSTFLWRTVNTALGWFKI